MRARRRFQEFRQGIPFSKKIAGGKLDVLQPIYDEINEQYGTNEKPGHEPETFIHLATLLPRHFALPRKGPKVLPMCPESGVTLLSGRAQALTRSPRRPRRPSEAN
jgi:hypothetical protein